MKNKVKVLLTTSISDTRDFYVASAPPIGLCRLQHYLVKRGIECDVLDLSIRPELEPDYVYMVEQGIYDIVGISVSHHNMVPELETLWKFRTASEKNNKDCLFIAGGQEATLNYEQWLEAGMDLIVMGFAEKRLHELCVRFSENNTVEVSELVKGMDGYAVRDKNGQIVFEPAKPFTAEEFRELSFEALMEMDTPYEDYWSELRKVSDVLTFHNNKFIPETARIFTASHCPMVCAFCSSRAFLPDAQEAITPVIMLSASEVHELIVQHVHKYGTKFFLLSDDDFVLGSKVGLKRVFDLCELIVESKNNGTIPADVGFYVQTRVDVFMTRTDKNQKVVNWDLIDAMKGAGFCSFGLGVETFSDRLLASPSMNKRFINEQDSCIVLDALLQRGLSPTINIILGIPETTVEEMIHSMEVAVEFFKKGCQIAVTGLMDSFPGASIHGHEDYPITTTEWVNPYNKQVVSISGSFIPFEAKIGSVIDRVRKLAAEELEKLKLDCGWTGPVIPKPISGLSVFIGVSKLVDRPDLAEYFSEVAHEALSAESSYALEYEHGI